jgi:F-type H+-transporting ATPase subunit b
MPQLDFSQFASQAFWIILCFCTLWLCVSVFIAPKIADIKEQRKRYLDEYIQKAERLNLQAKKSLDKYQKTLSEAKTSAEQDMLTAQNELSLYLQKKQAQLSEKLNKEMAESEFKLAKERKNTLQQIEKISVVLAEDIVKKLGFTKISEDDIKKIAVATEKSGK